MKLLVKKWADQWKNALVVLVILVAFGAILNVPPRTDESPINCSSNLKKISRSYQQYVEDYDEKLPPISAGEQGWVDILKPYLPDRTVFRCKLVDSYRVPSGSTDYFYNGRLAGLNSTRFNAVSRTILNGDGLPNAGSNAHIVEPPFEWSRDRNSPARRHFDGAIYSFVDGHVKWLRPEWLGNQPVAVGHATFAFE